MPSLYCNPSLTGRSKGRRIFCFLKTFSFVFKYMCCSETEEVRGGSQAAAGEELHRSERLPTGRAWEGSTLLTEVLCTETESTAMSKPVFLSDVQSGLFDISWTQLFEHVDYISVFSFHLDAMESLYVSQRGVCYTCSMLAC